MVFEVKCKLKFQYWNLLLMWKVIKFSECRYLCQLKENNCILKIMRLINICYVKTHIYIIHNVYVHNMYYYIYAYN